MDIDLLSKMVKDEILEHDRVTLPGVGCFQADLMPSTFSDKGYTINPPYRRLYFTQKEGDDTLLIDRYAQANGISRDDAAVVLVDFLTQLKEVLKVRKTIVFPALGRLRATRENNFFFVADEDLDIYPEGMNLEPVSLKNNLQSQSEVRRAVENLAAEMTGSGEEGIDVVIDYPGEREPQPVEVEIPPIAAEPVPETPAEPVAPLAELTPDASQAVPAPESQAAPAEPVAPETPAEPATPESPAEPVSPETRPAPVKAQPKEPAEPRPKSRFWHVVGRIFLILLILVLAVAIAWVVIGRVAPEIIDPLLYSPEELEILRWKP